MGKCVCTACVSLFVRCLDSIQCTCALMVTILHIKKFVTFDLDPSLISRLITDSDLGQIKEIFGHKLVDFATEL